MRMATAFDEVRVTGPEQPVGFLQDIPAKRIAYSIVLCSIAILALLSLSVVCYRLHLNLTTVSLLYVIVTVLLARFGNLISSIVASIVATLCLAHIAPPAFSFRVDDPVDDLAIAAFLITSLIIARLMSRVRKQAEQELSSVSCRVIEAEEHERQRMSETLHEDIAQRLTLLAIDIEQFKPDSLNAVGVTSRIDGLQKHTLEILTDVEALSHELYSPRLKYLSLAAVMKSFCKSFADRKGVEIDFKNEGLPSYVPPDVTLCLFRVLQEALHNAAQHSGVRRFAAKLWTTSDEIHLTVSDPGVGFNVQTADKNGGLGIHRMQERLKLVKGKLSLDSQPQRGTTIRACVPSQFR